MRFAWMPPIYCDIRWSPPFETSSWLSGEKVVSAENTRLLRQPLRRQKKHIDTIPLFVWSFWWSKGTCLVPNMCGCGTPKKGKKKKKERERERLRTRKQRLETFPTKYYAQNRNAWALGARRVWVCRPGSGVVYNGRDRHLWQGCCLCPSSLVYIQGIQTLVHNKQRQSLA